MLSESTRATIARLEVIQNVLNMPKPMSPMVAELQNNTMELVKAVRELSAALEAAQYDSCECARMINEVLDGKRSGVMCGAVGEARQRLIDKLAASEAECNDLIESLSKANNTIVAHEAEVARLREEVEDLTNRRDQLLDQLRCSVDREHELGRRIS